MKTAAFLITVLLSSQAQPAKAAAPVPDAEHSPAFKAYGRREINAQLSSIRLKSIHFEQATALDRMLETLAADARQSDYAHKAVNLLSGELKWVTVKIDPPLE